MKDERIQTAIRESAATGYFVVYCLMGAAICYRALILKQSIRDFWDILAVLCIGAIFVFVAQAGKGALGHGLQEMWVPISICTLISISVVLFLMGEIRSVGNAGKTLVGAILGMAASLSIAHALNLRWEREKGVGDGE